MDSAPSDDDTVRAAAAAIAAALAKALDDHSARSILLTRDEAVLTLGLIDGLAGMMPEPRDVTTMADRQLVVAYEETDGTPGDPDVEAIAAEIERRGLDL